ncbi:MAG: DUF5056 domain-containing protein [Pseudomonadota bacterium]
MTDERDQQLLALFAAADRSIADNGFSQRVVQAIRRRSDRAIAIRVAVAVAVVVLELMLESPLQTSLGWVTDVLSMPLLSVQSEWMAYLSAPINSVAGVLGILLLGLGLIYRRIH